MTASHMLRFMRNSVPSRVMPALLTTISIGPNSAMISAIAVWQASKSQTSNFLTAMPCSAVKAVGGRVIGGVVGDDGAASPSGRC